MVREMPSLDEIFTPRGLAVVGVSPSGSNPFATLVVEALKAAEYPAIYPVNPKYSEAHGLPKLEDRPYRGVLKRIRVSRH